VFLANQQVDWINQNGGLHWAASRCDTSAANIYGWAEASSYATPFVTNADERSHVVATIDIDAAVADANVISQVLRANGVIDTESYRKLGRNQLRVALFPSIEPDDVLALTRCIDHVVEAMAS
jgi:phosphoserine aminotransferase